MLQGSVVCTQRLVGDGQVTVRGSLRWPIVHLQHAFHSWDQFSAPASAAQVIGGATHLQGYLQLLPVIPDSLVIDAERMVRVAHVSKRPPLGCVIAQFLRKGQVGLVVL